MSKNAAAQVLIVDDHHQTRESMAFVLHQAGHAVESCSSAAEALNRLAARQYDCLITDLKMPGMSGIELIVELETRRVRLPIVMVTAHASVGTAVEAMRHGAFDYIEKPFDADQLERLVAQAIGHGRTQSPAEPDHDAPAMVGSSRAMQDLRARISQVAATPETVLILGESGTGKELVARTVHAAGDRRDGPMVSLNCPALSAHLLESELFGHEKGAFTGADVARAGRFERADGGSILLDEVTEIEPPLQAKLLRVLQERSFERVGSSETRRVDVRVMATTNRDLRAHVAQGRFREDLYFRLAVLPLQVPPLRERKEDIPELIAYFQARTGRRLGREPAGFDPSALELLIEYPWPGNVRELENLVTRAAVLATAPMTADELRRWLLLEPAAENKNEVAVGLSLEAMERRLIEATLEQYDGHREKTAKALGIGVRTLSGKLRQYGYAPRAKAPAG